GLSSIGNRTLSFVTALAQNLAPWVPSAGRVDLSVIAFGTLIALWLFTRRGAALQLAPRAAEILRLWSLALVPLMLIYPVMFWATHFDVRYTSPVLVVAIPLVACASAQVLLQLRMRTLRLALAAGLPLAFVVCCVVSFHRGRVGNALAVNAGSVAR